MITSFDLSFTAIDILSQGLGVNTRVFPFQIPSVGREIADRIRIAGAVRDDMTRRGLVRRGDLEPEVEHSLRLLADPEIAVAVLGTTNRGALHARASLAGRDGVIVVRDNQILRFTLVRAEAVITSVVALLPAARPGPGQSVSITRPAVVPPPDSDGGFQSAVRPPRSSSDAQLRMAGDILRRPRLGDGYFVVSKGKQRAPGLSWLDTDAGRYLGLARTDDRGDTHVTYFPGDGARIAHNLGDLVERLRRG
ncbi:ESX secretion-associated protein EspG [Actinokineospora sp.]|uniref:ESX secretion-associated protein EspG n=1 Tax=Actinokineospora sp. TaxID=1872133 RepID=UPI003D6BE7DE